MTVSIIVPVASDEWLVQCLDSIKAQTYKDIELIVEHDPQGTGAAATRNRGLERATGEMVAFCDADDYLEPTAIEKLVEAISGVDMACGSFRKFGDFESIVTHERVGLGMVKLAEYVMGNMTNPRSNQMLSGCWAKLFWRKKIGKFPLLTTAEDMAFNFSYLARCNTVKFISDVVYHNRKRKGSLTTLYDPKNKQGLFGFLEGLKYVRGFLHPYFNEEDIDNALDSSKVYHSLLYMIRICEDRGWTMQETFRELYP